MWPPATIIKEVLPLPRLKKAYLEITNVCNLACAFCPGTRREGRFLSPEEFRLLAARLRPHTDYLYFHLMGEPLLHPQLGQLLETAGALGFHVMLTTNGVLLPQLAHVLCASPALARVSVSLHSFEGNAPGPDLFPYLDGCFDFAAKAAQSGKRCALRLWNLDGDAAPGLHTRNEEILSRLGSRFPRPWKEGRRGITLAPNVFLEFGERFDWPDLSAPEGTQAGFCMGLRDQVGVLCDGTVVPCCLDHEGDIPLGNLFRQSLDEILASPRARALYDGFSRRQVTEPLCRCCGYRRRFS